MQRLECTVLFGWPYEPDLEESQQVRSKPALWLWKHSGMQ